jgi:glucosamine 6-phosphate synthetase-like amidotransferase/phosphosugar isomerase protein
MDHRENWVSNNSFIVAPVFVATGMHLLSHYIAMTRGIHKDTHRERGLTTGTAGSVFYVV